MALQEKIIAREKNLWGFGSPYSKMPLFAVSSHVGTVMTRVALSFGLYQLKPELKLLTRNRWRKKKKNHPSCNRKKRIS